MSQSLSPQFSAPQQQALAARLGMWVFLATEALFFGPLLLGYAYVRLRFPEAAGEASRHTSMALGTANTAILLTSSLCMALALEAQKAHPQRRCALLLRVTAALGLIFLAIKGVEYAREAGEHLFPGPGFAPGTVAPALRDGVQLFFLLYFALTGLHALHLAVGCVACLLLAWRRSDNAVEVAGLYWHFVDVVWVVLYPLLYLVQRSGGTS